MLARLQLTQLAQRSVRIWQRGGVSFAVCDHTIRVDDEQRPVGDPSTIIEDVEGLRRAAMGPEVCQQWMLDAAHRCRPSFESKHRVNTETQHLRICFGKLLQRTVEGRGLVASATGKGKGERMQNDPLATVL